MCYDIKYRRLRKNISSETIFKFEVDFTEDFVKPMSFTETEGCIRKKCRRGYDRGNSEGKGITR